MNVDISKLSLTELKSLAYDLIAHIEQDQRNLQIVNAKIAERTGTKPVINSLIESIKNSEE